MFRMTTAPSAFRFCSIINNIKDSPAWLSRRVSWLNQLSAPFKIQHPKDRTFRRVSTDRFRLGNWIITCLKLLPITRPTLFARISHTHYCDNETQRPDISQQTCGPFISAPLLPWFLASFAWQCSNFDTHAWTSHYHSSNKILKSNLSPVKT